MNKWEMESCVVCTGALMRELVGCTLRIMGMWSTYGEASKPEEDSIFSF